MGAAAKVLNSQRGKSTPVSSPGALWSMQSGIPYPGESGQPSRRWQYLATWSSNAATVFLSGGCRKKGLEFPQAPSATALFAYLATEAAATGAAAFFAVCTCLTLCTGLAAAVVAEAVGDAVGAWANDMAVKVVNTAAMSRFFFMIQSFISSDARIGSEHLEHASMGWSCIHNGGCRPGAYNLRSESLRPVLRTK